MCMWGGEGEGGGTLNFVCYIGWTRAASVYPEKHTVYVSAYRPYPTKSSCIAYLKNIPIAVFFFINVWFSITFPV